MKKLFYLFLTLLLAILAFFNVYNKMNNLNIIITIVMIIMILGLYVLYLKADSINKWGIKKKGALLLLLLAFSFASHFYCTNKISGVYSIETFLYVICMFILL